MIVDFIVAGIVLLVVLALAGVAVFLERGSAEEIRKRQAAPALAGQLPWWHIEEDGTIVGVDLRYSAVLSLVGVDIDCMGDDDVDQLQSQIHTMLISLDAGTVLQYIHINDHDNSELVARYENQVVSTAACAADVRRARVEKIVNSPGLRRSRLYLCLTLPHSDELSRKMGRTAKHFDDINELEHEDQLIKMQNLVRQTVGALRSASVECRQLIRDEVRSLAYEFLNPTRARTMSVPPSESLGYSEQQSMREKLCLSDLRENTDTIELDGRLIRVLTLNGLPTATDPAILEGLTVGIPFSCRIQVAFSITDDQVSLDALKTKRRRADISLESGKLNQEAEAARDDIVELIDENLASSIRMVKVSLSVVLSVDAKAPGAKEALEYQTVETLRILTSLNGCQGMVETYAQLDSWLACLPANSHHRTVRRSLCTSLNASHMALQYQGWPGNHQAAILLEDARNHLMAIDPFDRTLDTANAFIAGSSGSGKSVTTNYLLMHLFGGGAKGLIIDIGGSYRRLLSLYGGEYFTFDDNDAALNLFYEPSGLIGEDGSIDVTKLQFMIAVLESLLAEPERPSLSHEQIALLEAGVRGLYDTATQTPILSDLQDYLSNTAWEDPEDTEIARKIVRALNRWTKGVHARLLNRRGTVNLTSTCAGFDLKGLAEEVQGPVLLILSGVIWNLVTMNKTEKKIIVFDEVWKLLKSPTACKLIEELYRTGRKYSASIVTISQSVQDFQDSPIATALVGQSSMTYLLRHRSGHEVIAEAFNLNERELDNFRGLEMRRGEYSEILVLSGEKHHFVARVVLSSLEYWIATTHPPDIAFLQSIVDEHPHWEEHRCLTECARLAPNGAEALPSFTSRAAA